MFERRAMSEEIEKHILRKYEICQKLGKGVRACCGCVKRGCQLLANRCSFRLMALSGRQLTNEPGRPWH